MAQKENQRVALTKRLVKEGFLKLLKYKPIHQISIRELCEKAGINRSTFYNHFGSQYDVLSEIAQDYLNDIARTIESADFSDKHGVLRRVALVLQYVAENMELSTMLIDNNIDETFADRLFSLQKIEDMLNEALANVQSAKEKQAVVSFVINGSYKLVQDWINDEARISAEEQAALILKLAQRVCG